MTWHDIAAPLVRETRWFPTSGDDLPLRDLKDSWPSIRVELEFGVWHWRPVPRLYADDITHTYVAQWLGVKFELYGPDRKRR